MPRRRTTARWTRSSKRASRPTTRAFARATGACTAASASLLPPNPVSALAASAEEREAAFEQRWKIGGFAILGAFNDLLTERAVQRAGGASSCAARSAATVQGPGHRRSCCRRRTPSAASGCAWTAATTTPSTGRTCGWWTSATQPIERFDARGPAHRRPRLRVRRAGAGHRLRRDDRHDAAAGPARPRRPDASRTSGTPGR